MRVVLSGSLASTTNTSPAHTKNYLKALMMWYAPRWYKPISCPPCRDRLALIVGMITLIQFNVSNHVANSNYQPIWCPVGLDVLSTMWLVIGVSVHEHMRGSRDVSYYKCVLRVDTSNQTAIGTISNLQIWYGLRGVGIPKQNLIINTSFWARCNLSKKYIDGGNSAPADKPPAKILRVKYWWSLDIHPVEPPDFWSINSINSRLQDSWLPNIVNPRLHQQS